VGEDAEAENLTGYKDLGWVVANLSDEFEDEECADVIFVQ
jgi:hypothetical protein